MGSGKIFVAKILNSECLYPGNNALVTIPYTHIMKLSFGEFLYEEGWDEDKMGRGQKRTKLFVAIIFDSQHSDNLCKQWMTVNIHT